MKEVDNIQIKDDSGDRNYFTIIPNYVLNHSTATAQALYMQLKRLAGEKGTAYPSRAFLMKQLNISKPTLLKELDYLIDHKWIEYTGLIDVRTSGGIQKIKSYKMVDLWDLNNQFYVQKGVKKQTPLNEEDDKGGKKTYQKGVKKRTPKKEPVLRKNNTSDLQARSQEVKTFSLKEEIDKLNDNPRREMNVIALFIEEKRINILNKDQLGVVIKRNLRPAQMLSCFSDKQIIDTIKTLQMDPKLKALWTLETVIKLLTK